MKKNAMLKIAAVLLVAVLLTTCAISSTFAKYTSAGGKKTATARVAKWGVVATTEFEGGFGTLYADGNKIVSSTDAVVAPGTSGDFTISTSFDTSKKPEVSFVLDYTLTVQNDGTLPIVFYIGEDRSTKYDSTTIVNAIQDVTYKIDADNFDTQYAATETVTIHWEWDKNSDDTDDTTLGNNAAAGNAATITLTLESNIYQLVDAGDADTYKALT